MEKITTLELLPGRRGHNTRVQTINEEPSRTKQSFKKDTEIKTILRKYAKTGVLGDPTKKPLWGDFTNTQQFEDNLNLVANVRSQFAQLPASVRGRFKNDPVQLLDFLQDSANDKEAVELGLKNASVLPKPKPIRDNRLPADHPVNNPPQDDKKPDAPAS